MWHAVPHTADALLVVEATSWPELLAEAARAFCSWTAGGTALPEDLAITEHELEVTGPDATATWVDYWRALHRLWVVDGQFPVHAHPAATATPEHSVITVQCVLAAALPPANLVDVKAVTWHEAHAAPAGDGWRGTIVLDI